MDWLTFVARMTEALAWPCVLAVVLVWLRQPLERLVTVLKTARFKEFQLEFGEKLRELEARAEDAKLSTATAATLDQSANKGTAEDADPDDWTIGDYIERLAPISPRAAIAEAWRHVEIALREAGERNRYHHAARRSAIQIAKALASQGLLAKGAASIVEELARLRSRAVHGAHDDDIDPDEALEFGRLAERAIATIALAGITKRPATVRPSALS